MELTIDFFRFREREDFIAVSPGRGSVAMLSPWTASVNYFVAPAASLAPFSQRANSRFAFEQRPL